MQVKLKEKLIIPLVLKNVHHPIQIQWFIIHSSTQETHKKSISSCYFQSIYFVIEKETTIMTHYWINVYYLVPATLLVLARRHLFSLFIFSRALKRTQFERKREICYQYGFFLVRKELFMTALALGTQCGVHKRDYHTKIPLKLHVLLTINIKRQTNWITKN